MKWKRHNSFVFDKNEWYLKIQLTSHEVFVVASNEADPGIQGKDANENASS